MRMFLLEGLKGDLLNDAMRASKEALGMKAVTATAKQDAKIAFIIVVLDCASG